MDLKHLHFYDGTSTHQLMFLDDTIPGSQVVGSISGNAASITGTITESQVTGLVSGLASVNSAIATETTRAETVETGLSGSIATETAARIAGDASTLTAAESFSSNANNITGGKVGQAFLPTDVVYNNQANTYTAGSKQSFVASTGAGSLTGLSISGAAADPASLSQGDVWFRTDLNHLQFQDATNTPQSLAFMSDVTATDATTLTSAKSYTDTTAATTLSSAKGYTDSSVATEAAARMAADAATLASANSYTDTSVGAEKSRALAAEALKANLDGGNIFTGGSQKLAAATTNYSSLNVATGAAPDSGHVAAGDLWLTNSDSHLQFQVRVPQPTTARPHRWLSRQAAAIATSVSI
jgi:hypothetical protein